MEITKEQSKEFYSTKPQLVVANAYASQIKSDVWEKISEGFVCRTIAEFYEECSVDEFETVIDWNHFVYGEELCNAIDKAIDYEIELEETEMSNVCQIKIYVSNPVKKLFAANLDLDDPDHKENKRIREFRERSCIYW
jgi:hypothetical protein